PGDASLLPQLDVRRAPRAREMAAKVLNAASVSAADLAIRCRRSCSSLSARGADGRMIVRSERRAYRRKIRTISALKPRDGPRYNASRRGVPVRQFQRRCFRAGLRMKWERQERIKYFVKNTSDGTV